MNHVLAAARDSRSGSCVLVLFTITIFVSAVLLFAVQPMFAKMVLPLLGGTPAVWNTCMVFFQATLLAGYAYAHVTARAFRVRHQATIHLALLVTPLLLLPIAVPETWRSPSQDHPVTWLLALLIVALGLPFFVVSTTGPLVQAWFARSDHPLAHDPYFLYAASNTGSLAALLAYPTVVEPNLHLAEQSHLWSLGYVVLVLLLVGCAAVVWNSRTSSSPRVVPGTRSAADSAASISVWRRRRWILLAFIPSSLMLGLTTYVTTDVAPMPLLWVVPLSIYLFSFVLTFWRRVRVSYSLVDRLMPIFVVPLAATMAVGSVGGVWVLVPLHLITLFVASLLCHGELASSRPTADRLTEFYLWISIGGVLGGIFNALVAPAIFNSAVEYPLALAIACLVRRRNTSATPAASRRQDFRLAVVVAAAILGLLWLVHTLPFLSSLPAVPAIGVPALLCFAVRNRPLPFGLGIATLLIMGLGIVAAGDETLLRERSFFGVSQVRVYQPERLTLLLSATTKHGAQSPDPARRQEPLSYYYRTGPIGQVFAALPALDIPRVAIIGLGAGSLACYGKPGQQFTFYEIDPTVVRIARDPRYFTFLQLWEALRLYLRTLRESVLLAFHISNNRLDLEPTVANLARDAQLVALAQFDEKVSPDEARAGKTPSHWVVLARRWEDLRALPHSRHWHVLSAGPDTTLWTADFSNIFEAIKWR